MNFKRFLIRFNLTFLLIVGLLYSFNEINVFMKNKNAKSLSKFTRKRYRNVSVYNKVIRLNYVTKMGPGNLITEQKMPEAIIIGEAKCGMKRFVHIVNLI